LKNAYGRSKRVQRDVKKLNTNQILSIVPKRMDVDRNQRDSLVKLMMKFRLTGIYNLDELWRVYRNTEAALGLKVS